MLIKSITVTLVAPMSDHAANRGEKLMGNASSIKRRPDERVYISGQMQRHALFSAIERLNDNEQTRVANGDGPTFDITTDLRSDMGGFLNPSVKRRTAPISATPAVSNNKSKVGRDLLVRLDQDLRKDEAKAKDENGEVIRNSNKQALAINEYSLRDEMLMSFHLDIGAVGIDKEFEYSDKKHINTINTAKITEAEHRRRVELFLESTGSVTDYANQARNATTGEPQKVLIVLDNKMSRKSARYFAPETNETERKNILTELDSRGALYFLGDDTKVADNLISTVDGAYRKALETLKSKENQLYWPVTQKTPKS